MTTNSVKRWAAWDAFHDVVLMGALSGYFDLKTDEKARQAHLEGKVSVVEKLTKERVGKVGKPKFKKVPEKKRGLKAVTVKGSRAEAGAIYSKQYFKAHKPQKIKLKAGKK